ncbi:helicase-related protein [Williamsia sp. MIQD14]|uniref:helicase-related protein n=1 Tax=Williamsia sp. MIQD14 TaxID=3425703 RepID=UPI003D9FDE36
MPDNTTFRAEPYLAKLRPFQRATVDHVVDILYRSKSGKRFLVADETGLGKTMVARGVIASAIEALQDEPGVDRIDVVYICSNADVARQNVKKLDILGNEASLSTRLSLLAAETDKLKNGDRSAGKPVNLVSLTPKTAFPDKGWRGGTSRERALLHIIFRDRLVLKGKYETASLRLLQGGVGTMERFKQAVTNFEYQLGAAPGHGAGKLDAEIVDRFWKMASQPAADNGSLVDRFTAFVEQTAGKSKVPAASSEVSQLHSELRRTLARASVDALEPDLIILDEFQRFTELLDAENPIAELAHDLFTFEHAKVLLLSATPYKPIDNLSQDGSTHQSEFLGVLEFLAHEKAGEPAAGIEKLLAEYRQSVKTRTDPAELRDRIRGELLQLMCRTERPTKSRESMVQEREFKAPAISADAAAQFLAMSKIAKHVDSNLPMDIWKSVPELVHFWEAYKIGDRVRKQLDAGDEELKEMVASLRRLDPAAVDRFDELPVDNPRLQTLLDETTGKGWQSLLWMPPSLPYLKPGGPFASPDVASITKKLVFSSWTATPTAVASLVSHDASRRIARPDQSRTPKVTVENRDSVSQRIQFRRSGDRLSAMAGFLPFFPLPGLADMADPLQRAGVAGQPFNRELAESRIAGDLQSRLGRDVHESGASELSALTWQWPLALSDGILDEALSAVIVDASHQAITVADAIAGRAASKGVEQEDDRRDQGTAIDEYVTEAWAVHRGRATLDVRAVPPGLAAQTARLAMHSPANCAWRSFGRLSVDDSAVTNGGRWRAAAILASGLRALFNRWDSALLLDQLYGSATPYWQRVLQYCADGNLQAVLDEYLFHLVQVEGDAAFDDAALIKFAWHAASALKVTPAAYKAKDPLEEQDIDFSNRFAMRYGGARESEESARPSEIRDAFNSPFWPFVLVSTSVGQEGIDFHPWCHNLVHWNVPTNPVDFEQRDGRVNRFRGHAVRKNIAHQFSRKILGANNPWQEAYRLAGENAPHSDVPGLAPEWVYPGPASVARDVMPYQLSIDAARLRRTHERVALYRLAFGQPRQEDLMELMAAAGVSESDASQWRVDLRPSGAT